MRFLVAYDIAHPRRLRRVARLLEKRAVRCQKSVFLFLGRAADAEALLDEVAPLIDPKEDVVQAWRLARRQPTGGLVRGSATPVTPSCVVLQPNARPILADPHEPCQEIAR